MLLELVLVRRTLAQASRGAMGSILRAGARLRLLQWIAVVSTMFAVIGMGWLELLRATIGDLVVIDELLAILPALALICLLWIVQWPVERMLREAVVMRRLDRGLPVHPVPTASRHLLVQARANLLVVLVPAVFVLACVESAEGLVPLLLPDGAPESLSFFIVGVVAIAALVLSPFGVVLAVDAGPMPKGPMRDSLQSILDDAGVRVRDIRLWPSGGTLLNGAVIGFLPRLRFVLLTDGLVENMPEEEVRAVMAHEVGHLRHRHLPWTMAVLVGLIWLIGQLLEWLAEPTYRFLEGYGHGGQSLVDAIEWGAMAVLLVGVFIGFGWVSRRFELQADAFAAVRLSARDDVAPEQDTVDSHGAGSMCAALESVARMNGLNPRRHTWRHGSIRWRQLRLQGLVGRSTLALPVDREVLAIKLTVAVTMVLLGFMALKDYSTASDAVESISSFEATPLESSERPRHG